MSPEEILLDQEFRPDASDDISFLVSFIAKRLAGQEILRVVIYSLAVKTEHNCDDGQDQEDTFVTDNVDTSEFDTDSQASKTEDKCYDRLSDSEDTFGHDNLNASEFVSHQKTDPKIIRFRISEEQLEKKKKSKDSNVRIICEQCGKSLLKRSLREHQRKCRSDDVEQSQSLLVYCHYVDCTYTCRSKYTLRNHIGAIHMNQPISMKHLCTTCGKGFQFKHQLQCHISSKHLQYRDKVCPTCGKGFNTITRLNSHMEIHSEVRKYKCPACGNAFKQRATLNKHKQYCKAFKDFVPEDACHFCKKCGKGFKTEARLKLHMQNAKLSCRV